VFTYNSNMPPNDRTSNLSSRPQDFAKKRRAEGGMKSESEMLFSQFQTPQYKHSEIGNPISSPHTDERDSMLHKQKEIARNRLLAMNLLSQENSAQEDKEARRKRTAGHIKEELKDNTMNFDDLDLSEANISDCKTQQQLKFTQPSDERMEQIMLKNIWEIENNPIFSSGGSIGEELESLGKNKAASTKQNKI
jgi:hypothetical protein